MSISAAASEELDSGSDSESNCSLHPYSASSDDSDEDAVHRDDTALTPSTAFERLKSLLQQRDGQLSIDHQPLSAPPAAVTDSKPPAVNTLYPSRACLFHCHINIVSQYPHLLRP